MQRGPVDVLFFSFPADVDPADVVGVLREPVGSRLLSIIDVVLLVRASSLPEGAQGMAVVVEHAWAKAVDQDLADVQAELALYVRVPPEDVEAAFAAGQG
jgi:hypothetical protein